MCGFLNCLHKVPPERLVEEDVEDHVDGGVDHQKDVAGKELFFLFFNKNNDWELGKSCVCSRKCISSPKKTQLFILHSSMMIVTSHVCLTLSQNINIQCILQWRNQGAKP